MRTGPKGKSNLLKVVGGTAQPCRMAEPVHAEHEGEPARPKWVKGLTAKVWKEKVEKFLGRGQAIADYGDALAQYCALEAELIDMRKKSIVPPMAMVNAHRIWAAEFFDTPASNQVTGNKKKDNPFEQHGLGL